MSESVGIYLNNSVREFNRKFRPSYCTPKHRRVCDGSNTVKSCSFQSPNGTCPVFFKKKKKILNNLFEICGYFCMYVGYYLASMY